MGSVEIIEGGKEYDSESDVWVDKLGRTFIKNEFDPNSHKWITVGSTYWHYEGLANNWIDWEELNLPLAIEKAFKRFLHYKLRRNALQYIKASRYALQNFSQFLTTNERHLSDLSISFFVRIWSNLIPHYASWVREAYSWLASHGEEGATASIAIKLKGMKVRKEVRLLKDVLNWHPLKGALTQEEEVILRNSIERRNSNEDINDLGKRLFCWLLISTLKRSKQIRELKENCLKTVESNNTVEYFVLIKPVKAQTGDPERWWPIQEALYIEMLRYSSDPDVKILQERHDCFWVHPCASLDLYGSLGAADAKGLIQNYIKNTLELNSPRTGNRLHVTPTRLRHTGGTRLAFKGVPRDIISEILEHDSPESCQAYIDAVGSELCPSMDRADRNMGSLFMELNKAYFQGAVVDELIDQPIVIPDFTEADANPLFVGSCGRDTCKEGTCKKHPFVGCYNGCSSFLAWREADHKRALDFADKELERWRDAIGNPDQASTIKEYEDLRNNIQVVIERISQLEGGA